MAERPVFVPVDEGAVLFREVPVRFDWHAGMAASQKKKNVAELHKKAAARGISPILEVSSKSERELGLQLSAFNLALSVNGKDTTVECAYQASKVFEHGGPFLDLISISSREAKRDERLKDSGKLVGFEFEGERYPLSPPSAFYDWLYVNALNRHAELHQELIECSGFTDIEFNPEKSINCQARSCAIFVSLEKRGETMDALDSFGTFAEKVQASKF